MCAFKWIHGHMMTFFPMAEFVNGCRVRTGPTFIAVERQSDLDGVLSWTWQVSISWDVISGWNFKLWTGGYNNVWHEEPYMIYIAVCFQHDTCGKTCFVAWTYLQTSPNQRHSSTAASFPSGDVNDAHGSKKLRFHEAHMWWSIYPIGGAENQTDWTGPPGWRSDFFTWLWVEHPPCLRSFGCPFLRVKIACFAAVRLEIV